MSQSNLWLALIRDDGVEAPGALGARNGRAVALPDVVERIPN